MEVNINKVCKIAGAACAAAGVIALSAVAASCAALTVVADSFKTVGRAMKDIANEPETEAVDLISPEDTDA